MNSDSNPQMRELYICGTHKNTTTTNFFCSFLLRNILLLFRHHDLWWQHVLLSAWHKHRLHWFFFFFFLTLPLREKCNFSKKKISHRQKHNAKRCIYLGTPNKSDILWRTDARKDAFISAVASANTSHSDQFREQGGGGISAHSGT